MPLTDLFDPSPSEDTPIACDMTALSDPDRHAQESEALLSEREDERKLAGGYALRFPGTMEYAERALDFVGRERQCCPFLTFEIVFEPEQRGVWLYMGGDETVEAYLEREFESSWLE